MRDLHTEVVVWLANKKPLRFLRMENGRPKKQEDRVAAQRLNVFGERDCRFGDPVRWQQHFHQPFQQQQHQQQLKHQQPRDVGGRSV